jgi:iron complex transport system substrate-binding protein
MQFRISIPMVLGALAAYGQPLAEPKDTTPRARMGSLTYPRVAMDAFGGTIKLDRPAKRIVALHSDVQDFIYQIVPPEYVVGVDGFAYDENFSAVVRFVKAHKPQIVDQAESIIALKPDLVIGTDATRPELLDRLREAGIPMFRMASPVSTLKLVSDYISIFGYLTGSDEGAERERARFERELAAIENQCKSRRTPPRIFGLSMTGFSYGDQTLFHDLVRLMGGINVAADGLHTYQRTSSDGILHWNPDWVFSWKEPGLHEKELERWMNDPALKETTAAKKSQIIVGDPTDVLPVSPLITKLGHTIADATCKPAE